ANDRAQIVRTVERFAATGHGDVKKLHAVDGYRIRMRERRILITFLWNERVILVIEVIKRGDAYIAGMPRSLSRAFNQGKDESKARLR
ncbi:MAG: type II toxin-antitoxin system RelE family toxin, partial [Polyangiaceae bacterium]